MIRGKNETKALLASATLRSTNSASSMRSQMFQTRVCCARSRTGSTRAAHALDGPPNTSRLVTHPGGVRIQATSRRYSRMSIAWPASLEVAIPSLTGRRSSRRGRPANAFFIGAPSSRCSAHSALWSAGSGLHEGASVRRLGRRRVAGGVRRDGIPVRATTIYRPAHDRRDRAVHHRRTAGPAGRPGGPAAPDPLARRGDDRRHRRAVEAGPAAPVRATAHRALVRRPTTGGGPRRSSTRSRSSARRSTASASTSSTCARRRPTRCRW